MGDQFALKNNQIFVLAEAAGGVYNSDQLRVLCEVADNESAFLKITEDQRIGFMVDPNKLGDIQAQVRKSGLLLRSYKSSGVPSPRACLGELCNFAHQPSLGDALELATHLLKSFPAPKRFSTIGVNGCQRACLGSSTEDIHIVAEESGYKISIGGKGSDIPQQAQLILDNIPRVDLPVVVEKILAVFYQESQEGERIIDVIDRIGLSPFFDALPEHLVPNIHQASTSDIEETNSTDSSNNLADPLDALLDVGEESEMLSPDAIAEAATLSNSNLTDGLADELVADEVAADQPVANIETALQESDSVVDSDSLAGDLLEVSENDLEEGSLEDVERVRDAIRTELSMSTMTEQNIRPRTTDLLEELNTSITAELGQFDSAEENELQSNGIVDVSEFDDDGLIPNDALDNIESDTAASIEHRGPRKNQQTTRQKPAAPSKKTWNSGASSTPVGGRLGIRFVGEQLSVELPSGLSFELPLDSVSEGEELAMSLPDGDLRIQRDGQMLAVSLGMLNLKIPLPQLDSFQVA
ncbi:hypothetical protein EBR21_00205 [bacterium]|nr:hypothetical protein [bacterium]